MGRAAGPPAKIQAKVPMQETEGRTATARNELGKESSSNAGSVNRTGDPICCGLGLSIWPGP
ncbi:hypothetical protein Ahy_B05g074432 isoform B [Arachis hypogaea]|uniref:Uncharacterized protein n=1 Tax=Arachis hypogaea TaxID=3818 RepID=A0A444YZ63_ARAHY|nr:hypothetical protein Ahy_B05g074432 isoform B [Arachis hypogaea]